MTNCWSSVEIDKKTGGRYAYFQWSMACFGYTFTAQDTVNTSVLRELVGYLLEKHIGGLYVCGTTGEGIYMSLDERKLVGETVIAQVDRRIPVIVHVGCVAVSDAVELAQHAQQAGADGISSILPPLYRNNESLYTYCRLMQASGYSRLRLL